NAQQAMGAANGRGALTLRTSERDRRIRIEIRDDGPGIAPEDLPKVFDPFFTTKAEGKGTGLGLAICLKIIAEHEGRIWAESGALEPGAAFVIQLPVLSPPFST